MAKSIACDLGLFPSSPSCNRKSRIRGHGCGHCKPRDVRKVGRHLAVSVMPGNDPDQWSPDWPFGCESIDPSSVAAVLPIEGLVLREGTGARLSIGVGPASVSPPPGVDLGAEALMIGCGVRDGRSGG